LNKSASPPEKGGRRAERAQATFPGKKEKVQKGLQRRKKLLLSVGRREVVKGSYRCSRNVELKKGFRELLLVRKSVPGLTNRIKNELFVRSNCERFKVKRALRIPEKSSPGG